jgi:hypothetical protein
LIFGKIITLKSLKPLPNQQNYQQLTLFFKLSRLKHTLFFSLPFLSCQNSFFIFFLFQIYFLYSNEGKEHKHPSIKPLQTHFFLPFYAWVWPYLSMSPYFKCKQSHTYERCYCVICELKFTYARVDVEVKCKMTCVSSALRFSEELVSISLLWLILT